MGIKQLFNMPMASVGQEFRKGAKGMVRLYSMMSGSQLQDSTSAGWNVCRLIHFSAWWLVDACCWLGSWLGLLAETLYFVFPRGLLGLLTAWWLGSQGKWRDSKREKEIETEIEN